ncbi:permease [Thalassobaculum sp.]|uniref:permease n=1 Tax=Thalassobaculum sp. TaxID=2022740 RepID=UPI0032EEFCF6
MMSALQQLRRRPILAAGAALAAAVASSPTAAVETLAFVVRGLLEVAPVVGVGLLLAAWVTASGVGDVTARLFRGNPATVVVIASAIGAVTPVCGVTVLPLMTGFLAAGVPLAPIMAFWLSSPVTDPGLFAATWTVLGPAFAVGKTVAAFALGLIAGAGTAALGATDMVRHPLRARRGAADPTCRAGPAPGYGPRIWQDPARMRVFRAELLWMARLVTLCLAGAFAAEHLLRDLLPPDIIASAVGSGSPYAIPVAVTVGAPLYLDGYAALPLVRGLLELGMAPGAALGFLVAGSAVSIWGVLAVVPVLRASTAILFVALAVAGSLAAGYTFEGFWALFT